MDMEESVCATPFQKLRDDKYLTLEIMKFIEYDEA